MRLLSLYFLFCIVPTAAWSQSENWPRFRGPNGSGLNTSRVLPTDLSPESALWSIDLPGIGHSSPIVWGNFLWTTSFDQKAGLLNLTCNNAHSGKLLWNAELQSAPHPMHRLNNSAASSPAVDQNGIYLLNYQPGRLELLGFDHAGKELWKRDFGPWVAQHGFATSPIAFDGKVIFLNSQESFQGLPEPENSVIFAVDARTGNDVWTTELVDDKACYAVPTIWKDASGKDWLVCATQGDGILLVDPVNGETAWNQPVLKQRTVGSPILVNNQVFANNGSGGGGNFVVCVPLDAKDHAPTYEIHEGASYVPTLIAVDKWLFVFADNGVVTCNALSDGHQVWKSRICDGFWASPVSDGRHLYCLDRKGNAHVLVVGEEAKLVGSFHLGRESQASAAISDGRIFFRTLDRLWCFGRQPAKTN